LPVFLNNNGPGWIPYFGTNISIENFGFYASLDNDNVTIPRMMDMIGNVTEEEFWKKLEYVKKVRYHYTYEGVLKEILDFFQDPFGSQGGHLRCMGLPWTEN
jgi:hypothetical protein